MQPITTPSPLQPDTPAKAEAVDGSLILHPIQLEFVAAKELTIRSKMPPAKDYRLPEGQAIFGGSISVFDEATRKFQVTFVVTIGDSEFSRADLPLYLRIELVGGFVVTVPEIKAETAIQWANAAARFTLLPYLREHVAGLSSRAGYSPVMIPLLQVPVLQPPAKVEASK
jgi:preprotein translocase subunit SecB